jgi:hypothetical protein
MGDTYSLLSFHRNVISLCSYEKVMFNYDYLVVENDDNKNVD